MTQKKRKEVLSTRIAGDVITNLHALCTATERDHAYHVDKALREYLEREMWQVSEIDVGVEAADAGKLTDLDDVKKQWEDRSMGEAQ